MFCWHNKVLVSSRTFYSSSAPDLGPTGVRLVYFCTKCKQPSFKTLPFDTHYRHNEYKNSYGMGSLDGFLDNLAEK